MPTSYDAVLADSPVGFWRLNETSGTTFADSSGNGHDGTFSGATLGQAAINPDNTGSVVGTSSGYGVGYIANTGNWMPSGTTWTVEGWVRPNNTDDVVGLMARYNTDTTGGWIIWQRNGKLSLTVINTSGQQDGVGVTLTAGEVSHVALKQSGSTFTFYVNGRGVWRYTVSGGWSGGANNNRLQIGGYNGAGQWSRANFSDVALFSTALSDDRIAAHAATKLTTATPAAPTAIPNVRGWWDASAITGVADNTGITSWSDSSSNGKTVTASTAPKYRTAVLNNKAVVRFVGNGDNMTAASALSAASSSFTMSVLVRVPAKQASASAKPMALATSSGNGMTFILDSTPTRGIFAPGNYATFTGGLYTAGDWERWTLVGSGSTVTLYVNNIAVQVATLQQAQTSVSLGGAIGFTDNWPIDIAEAAVWDRALTAAERNSYDAYLYNKWFSTAPAIPVGTASGAFSFAGSATGKRVAAGVAAGALAFAGVAVGKAPVKGSAVGSIAYVGAAAGVAPAVGPRTGSAAGSFAFTGAATGSSPVKGNASGAFSFAGAAAGVTPAVGMKFGTAAGSFSWVGAASGAPANRAGSAAGGFSFVGAATGSNTAIPMGSATGTILWRGVAFGANGTTTIPGWDVDDSGQTTLGLGGSGELDVMPPLALPPEGYVERPLIRRSVVVPAMHTISGRIVDPVTGGIRIPDDVYDALPLAAPVQEVGVPHILFPNFGDLNDVTYFRGGIIRIGNMRMEEPFGDVTLSIEIPLLTSMDPEPNPDNPDDPLFWTMNRANVEIVLRHPDGTVTRLWAGHIISHDIGNDSSGAFRRLTAVGSLRQAATDVLKVPNMLDPTDIGTLIPRALNGVASRRYPKIGWVSTGIMSRQRGSWSDSPLGYTQSLLSTSFTPAGNQWTVSKVEGTRRTYELRPKDTTPTLTVTNGARGVEVDLTRDATSTRNVIYGHGVADNGYAWWNYKYPNLSGDTAPLYPGSLMGLGASGAGVTLWQQRVKDLGYSIAVDGTISSSDVAIIQTVQRRFGVQVDGVIGPQTWAATFDVGGNGGDLSGVIRLPLAADPRTQPYLYNLDGSVAGDNPAFDRNVIIYADDVDFGSGITRAEGIQSAQQILERESEPGLTGRIVLNSDPREMSRFLIRPGRKLRLVGFEQADRVLHITAVDIDWQSLSVTLEVDEKSRDAMTVAQIRERDKEARRDPARRPGNANRRSRLDVDQVVPFDGESGAGRIPKFATYGGLWSVIRIPVSETGRVAIVDMQTSAPTSQLFVAMFGAPIQPAHLVKYVGNPSSTSARWEQNREVLEDTFGWIEAFGSPDEPGGYWPGLKSNSSPLTGRLKDTGGFEYVSAKPPWVWVAVWTPVSSYVSGRVLPAPVI